MAPRSAVGHSCELSTFFHLLGFIAPTSFDRVLACTAIKAKRSRRCPYTTMMRQMRRRIYALQIARLFALVTSVCFTVLQALTTAVCFVYCIRLRPVLSVAAYVDFRSDALACCCIVPHEIVDETRHFYNLLTCLHRRRGNASR